MATYVTTFEFGVAGDAEQKLRQLKELLDQVKQAGSSGNSTIGDTIKASAEKGEGALKALNSQLEKLPKDKQVDIKTETGKSEAAISDLEDKVSKLPKDKQVDVKIDAGSSRATMSELVNSVNKLPKAKETKIDVNAGRSNATMTELMAKFSKLPKDKQITIDVNAGRSNVTMSEMVRNLYKIPKSKDVKISADTSKAIDNTRSFNDRLKDTESQSGKTRSAVLSVFSGTAIANGVATIASKVTDLTKSSLEVAEAGEQIKRVWESLGTGDKGATALITQMADLRAKTGYSADEITKMQRGFYGLTNNVGETEKLSTALAGIGVASGLSGTKVSSMTRTIGRLMSSSSVTTTMLARLESQAPKLGSALASAAGMGKTQFDKLVDSGKLTGKQFQDLMEKVAKQSPSAFAKFGETGAGALAQIKGAWLSDKSIFGSKLLTVQSTGLQDLKTFLGSTAMKGLIEDSAEGLASLAGIAAKGMSEIAKYSDVAKAAVGTISSIVGDVFGVAGGTLKMFGVSFESNVDGPIKKSPILGILGNIKKGFADLAKDVSPVTSAIGGLAGVLAAGAFNNAKSLFSGIAESLSSIKGGGAAQAFDNLAKKIYPVTNDLNIFLEKSEPVTKALGEMAGHIAIDVWKDFGIVLGTVGSALKIAGSFIGTVAKGIASIFGVKLSGNGLGALGGILEGIAKNKVAVEAVAWAITAMLTAKMASSGLSTAVGLIYKLKDGYGALSGFKGLLGRLFSVSGAGGFAESFAKLKALPGILKSITPVSLQNVFKGLTSGFSLPKMLGGKGMTIGMKAQISNMKDLPMLGKAAAAAVGVGIAASSGLDIYKGIKAKNPSTKFKDIGSGIGTAVGGGIGFAMLGPEGAMIGATIGKQAGKWGGEATKQFVDGWNKKGKGAKPPSGLLPKAGYYARSAADGVASFAKSFAKGWSKTWSGLGKTITSGLKSASKGIDNFTKSFSKGWNKTWSGVGKGVKSGMSSAKKNVTSFGSSVGKWLGGFTKSFSRSWSKHWNGLKSSASKGLSSAQKGLSSFGAGAGKWLGSFTKMFARNWSSHWKSLKSTTSSGLNSAKKVIDSFGTGVVRWLSSFVKEFVEGWTNNWNNVKKIASDIFDDIKGVFTSFGKGISNWWSDFSSGFKKGWHSFWSGISDFFSNIFKKLGSFAKAGINDVIGFINGGIGGVNKVISFFGSSKSIGKIATLATGTGGHSGGPALINDGKGPDYKELVITPDNHMMMAQDRNVLIPDLPVGSQVLSGSDTKNYFNSIGIDHYASGTSGALGWVKGKLEDIGSWVKDKADTVEKLLKHPLAALENIWDKAVSALIPKSDFGKDFAPPAGKYMIKQAESWFKSLLKKADDDLGDAGGGKGAPSGSGVQRWKSQVIQALKANGLSTSTDMVNRVLRQIATESTGNEKAVQRGSDPDGDGSGPAMGLMQTKRGTFNSYKFPGHGSILNGYDDLLAALHYAKVTYGPSLSFLGNGHGYADGGILNSPEFALVGEAGKEYIINPARPSAMKLIMGALKDTLAKQPVSVTQAFKPKSYSSSASLSSFAGITDQASDNSLLGRIDKLVDNTQKLIDKNQDIYMDSEKVTKQVSLQGAKDINILQAQLGGN